MPVALRISSNSKTQNLHATIPHARPPQPATTCPTPRELESTMVRISGQFGIRLW